MRHKIKERERMLSFIEQATLHAQCHQKTFTRYTHFAGVLFIAFSLMLFFSFLHLTVPGYFSRTCAEFLTLLLFVYYFVLNWRLALSVALPLLLLLWLADWLGSAGPTSNALLLFASCFIVGCILQFLGHMIERNRPGFRQSMRQMLIAPLVLTAEVYFMFGKMQKLHAALHQDAELSSKQ